MAEAVVLVCDECGRPDAKTITIRTGTANYVKDLCDQHLKALLANTRAPRRGRPRASGAPASTGTTRRTGAKSGHKRSPGRKRTRRKSRAASK